MSVLLIAALSTLFAPSPTSTQIPHQFQKTPYIHQNLIALSAFAPSPTPTQIPDQFQKTPYIHQNLIALSAFAPKPTPTQFPHHFLEAPDIHQNLIAFSAEGDIWLSNLKTHSTRRLTSDPGLETFPKFSPNGREIAFEGSYGGKIDIYVMPTEGGIPHRVTYDPTVARLLGWTPDGKDILFRSNRRTALEPPQLFTIPWRGGPAKKLPVPQAFFAEFSPNGKELAYVPDSNEWMNWFRYQAGEADSIWLTDLSGKHFTQLTHTKWVDTTPVWVGKNIFFVSERSGVRNLWELNPTTQVVHQITYSTTVPVRYPSTDGHRVIYSIGPNLGVYDPSTFRAKVLDLRLHSDRLHARPADVPIATTMESASIGPTAKRVVIIDRGQMVTVASKHGEMHILEDDATQRSRNAAWSPDGKQIAFISDKSGEEQLYVVGDQSGDKPRQVTTQLTGEHFRPVWSPNGKWIVIGDRTMEIQLVNVKSGKITLIDQADRGGSYDQSNQDYTFSPDSQWVAYSKMGFGWNTSVWIYNIADGKKIEISDPEIASSSPTFSPDGKFLYMIQTRIATMTNSQFNAQLAYENPNVVTAVALTNSAHSPFLAKDDEEGEVAKPASVPVKKKKPTKVKPKTISIDLKGIQNRLIDVGLPPSNYVQITAIPGGKLIVGNATTDTPPHLSLEIYLIAKKKATPLAPMMMPLGNDDDPLVFQVSDSWQSVLIRTPAGLQILPTMTPAIPGKGMVPLAGLVIRINTVEQWKEMFDEAWRIARDFYIDPNMGGVNWLAVKKKYEAQLPMVGDRTDLTRLLGDMLAELSTGHCYTSGPNPYMKMGPPLGFLGANIGYDSVNKAWKIKRILDAGRWNFQDESPLSAPGLNVKVGDYILAVNGEPVQTNCEFEKNLVGTAGHITSLTISSDPKGKHSRVIRLVPMASERHLRYLDWVEGRKKYVKKATDGQVAYVHLSDMENAGGNEFAQMYYSNVEMPGIIMDVRGNGGGYISYNILEPLATKTIGFSKPRFGLSWRRESWGPLGHIVGICNEWDFSDGEQFSEDFKRLHIGPLVGHRTGGGEIGSGNGYLLADGGAVYVPDYGSWVVKGHKWIVEGRGVEPNYPIDQNPALVMEGKDPQLDEAIKLELDYLKAHPFSIPGPPVFPNHTEGSRSEKGVSKH